jgi:hypothetical protein
VQGSYRGAQTTGVHQPTCCCLEKKVFAQHFECILCLIHLVFGVSWWCSGNIPEWKAMVCFWVFLLRSRSDAGNFDLAKTCTPNVLKLSHRCGHQVGGVTRPCPAANTCYGEACFIALSTVARCQCLFLYVFFAVSIITVDPG